MSRALIDQANSEVRLIDAWALGGGTALMLHIGHRQSRDIDVFLSDPQHLALLNPEKRDLRFEVAPNGHSSDGTTFVKFVFDNIGEIDFIVGAPLTANPTTKTMLEGAELLLESVPEIIIKKIYHRGASIKPRDVFDIAAAGQTHAAEILCELKQYKDEVLKTLTAIEKLNPDFVARTIQQLAIEPAYAALARTASQRAIEILRSVSA